MFQLGLLNDPEARGDVLTEFGPIRAHLDPVQANVYGFGIPDLRTCLPMSASGSEKNDDMLN